MVEIIVSIQHAYQQTEYDLEVSTNMSVGKCIEQVAVHLGWLSPAMISNVDYSVELVPGCLLPLDQSLEQANVWSGAALIFHPPASVPQQQPKQQPAADPPVSGYQFIQID